MTILKDHISLITFLRPGFIEVEIEKKIEKLYVEEGTVEFFNNKLLILSSSATKTEKLSKEIITKMIEDSKILLQNSEIQDKDRYVLNHKLETLQQIN
jgi:F-type H+-transporting ATPase subunit epsilon